MKATLIKNTLYFVLSSIIGAVFIYSGYTKLYPIEPFELTFVDLGIANWQTAPFIARFMIGIEFLLGFMFLMNISLRTITIKLGACVLILFNIYLIFIIAKQGNNGNCGCFGNEIAMTPIQAIIKNMIMLIALFFIYKYYNGFDFKKHTKLLNISIAIFSFALPHILNYVDFSYSEAYLTPKENQFKLELDSLYADAKIHTPPQNLKNGKHVIAFMSMTCSHCRIAAKKLKIIKDKNPAISIYIVLNGEYTKIQPFFDDTKARNIDYCVLNGKNFVYLAGLDMPAIFMVNNSVVEHWINYMELDQKEIEKWLDKP